MKVVIIEDEQFTINDLVNSILKVDSGINIVAKLDSVRTAISWFNNHLHPDLIFSDIQLGDGLCFEIFKKVSISSPIIFCTAYDEYALKAFKENSIDYILKPFNEEDIADALSKYKVLENAFSGYTNSLNKIINLFEERKGQRKGSILVYHHDKIFPIRLEQIALFYIKDEITYILTLDKQKYTINKSLDELTTICGADFYRANRQYLIHRKAIKEASQYFMRSLSVKLSIPYKETIKINKVKVTDFLNWLSK